MDNNVENKIDNHVDSKAENKLKKKKRIILSGVLLLLLLGMIGPLMTVDLTQKEYYIRDGESIQLRCNSPFFQHFLRGEKIKKEKEEYHARLFFRRLPYTVHVIGWEESPILCKTEEMIELPAENLSPQAEITFTTCYPEKTDSVRKLELTNGRIVLNLSQAGNYQIKIEDHGYTFSREITVIDDHPICMKKGQISDLPAEGHWIAENDILSIKDGKITALEEGETSLAIIREEESEKATDSDAPGADSIRIPVTVLDIPEYFLGDNRHNNEIALPQGLGVSVRDEKMARIEGDKLILLEGGETEVILKKGESEFVLPLYISSYQNGEEKGYATLYSSDGSKKEYTIFEQHSYSYRKYNKFLAHNGCSTCSLASILSAYTDYKDPVDAMDYVEKPVVGESRWLSHHHQGRDGSAMPITLYGVNQCLESQKISTEYVPFFRREEMKEDIWNCLQQGNVVIIEISKTNQVTRKTDRYWSGSVHTVILLGCFGEDGVYVGDPANVRNGSGRGRIKESTLSSISQYMWSCKAQPTHFYWNGRNEGGGYIKIYR